DGNNAGTSGSGVLINQEGTLTIANSSFVNNIGEGAGGISNESGTMTLTNSTVAENAGRIISAGGINNGGILLLQNTTVAENTGGNALGTGGINNGGTLLLQNTIIARNKAGRQSPSFPSSPPDCEGTIISLGNNLIGDPTGCDITLQPTDLTGDPGLGAFTDN